MGGDLGPLHFAKFVYGQLFGRLPVPSESFEGKTVIVTGSNIGLGMEASRHIARLGAAKLVLAVRSVDKGEAAKRSIMEAVPTHGEIEVWPLDLDSYDSVQAFAARASKDLDRVDVLLENAGIALVRWDWAGDNERTIKINVVSTFLLALLMLPKMKETASRFRTRPVMTVITSETHGYVDFEERNAPEGIFERLNNSGDDSKTVAERYPTSKLVQVFLVRELARRLTRADQCPVTVNMVNPGLCKSELAREGDLQIRIAKLLFARPTEVGSRTLVNGASGDEHTHGQYLSQCRVAAPASLVTGPDGEKTQQKLWGELMVKLDKIVPGVSENV